MSTPPAIGIPSGPATAARGRWLYALLLGTETAGAAMLYVRGVPFYRALVIDTAQYAPSGGTQLWTLSSMALMQVAYWTRHRARPALPRYRNALLGHLLLFVARLSFVLATSVFSFVFMTRKLAEQMPPVGYALTAAALFSLFCYMLELQRLGNALAGADPGTEAQAR